MKNQNKNVNPEFKNAAHPVSTDVIEKFFKDIATKDPDYLNHPDHFAVGLHKAECDYIQMAVKARRDDLAISLVNATKERGTKEQFDAHKLWFMALISSLKDNNAEALENLNELLKGPLKHQIYFRQRALAKFKLDDFVGMEEDYKHYLHLVDGSQDYGDIQYTKNQSIGDPDLGRKPLQEFIELSGVQDFTVDDPIVSALPQHVLFMANFIEIYDERGIPFLPDVETTHVLLRNAIDDGLVLIPILREDHFAVLQIEACEFSSTEAEIHITISRGIQSIEQEIEDQIEGYDYQPLLDSLIQQGAEINTDNGWQAPTLEILKTMAASALTKENFKKDKLSHCTGEWSQFRTKDCIYDACFEGVVTATGPEIRFIEQAQLIQK